MAVGLPLAARSVTSVAVVVVLGTQARAVTEPLVTGELSQAVAVAALRAAMATVAVAVVLILSVVVAIRAVAVAVGTSLALEGWEFSRVAVLGVKAGALAEHKPQVALPLPLAVGLAALQSTAVAAVAVGLDTWRLEPQEAQAERLVLILEVLVALEEVVVAVAARAVRGTA